MTYVCSQVCRRLLINNLIVSCTKKRLYIAKTLVCMDKCLSDQERLYKISER